MERGTVARESFRGGKHLRGGAAGLLCCRSDAGDVGGDLDRSFRRLLDAAGDFLGGRGYLAAIYRAAIFAKALRIRKAAAARQYARRVV
jgi:hypothetical protein